MGGSTLEVVGVTTDGTVHHTTRRADGSWAPFTDLTASHFLKPAVDVACVERLSFPFMTGPLGLFVTACSETESPRTVFRSWEDGAWVVTELPVRTDPPFDPQVFPPGTRHPSAAISLSAAGPSYRYVRHVAATRADGRVSASRVPDADMSGNATPQLLDFPVAVRATALYPASPDEITGEDRVALLLAGADGVLHQTLGNADHWRAPRVFDVAGPLPGDVVDVAVATNGPLRTAVVVVTGDGRLLVTALTDGGGWGRWVDAETLWGDVGTFAAASAALTYDGPSGHEQLQIVGVTTDGRLLHMLIRSPFTTLASLPWAGTPFGDVEVSGVGQDIGYVTAARCC
ncbi:hypothetical protein Acsp06_27000 [Actinomycetospora sp. NBRC 106375]|uniref:hypothetical protein n=1 Tax=Actinomycetospora sp. NBRC 106375 TaxID=3032207 RepID=UPI0024A075DB|nr:hypothetical protein [Actinomycetospora sp. NBRC 106375]GLZ46515.1 hypothetical protein Acsp06_27000 [Actinomycetospora sp. NBRC 106375]